MLQLAGATVAAAAVGAAVTHVVLSRRRQSVAQARAPLPREGTITTNDGLKLHYVRRGDDACDVRPVVLIHGWSGSHRYFENTMDEIAARTGGAVYAFDLRFHGRSDKPSWGFHVHRLAADLADVLAGLGLDRPVVVGTSLGCAVIWAFIELYGDSALGSCVFVDQAPCQWALDDWQHCSKGIFDAASLARIQAALRSDMPAFAAGNGWNRQ